MMLDSMGEAIRYLEERRSYFFYKKGNRHYQIPARDILYFEALNRKIKIISVPKEMELPGYPLHSPFSFYTGNKSFPFIAGNIRRQ